MVTNDSTLNNREAAAGAVLSGLAADAHTLSGALSDIVSMGPDEMARALVAAEALAVRMGMMADRAAHALGRARCQSDADWLANGTDRDALTLLTREPEHT